MLDCVLDLEFGIVEGREGGGTYQVWGVGGAGAGVLGLFVGAWGEELSGCCVCIMWVEIPVVKRNFWLRVRCVR